MPKRRKARPEGTKCPMAALLPDGGSFARGHLHLNYALTIEEYVFAFQFVFALSIALIELLSKNEPGKLWKVRETMQVRTFVKDQKHTLPFI